MTKSNLLILQAEMLTVVELGQAELQIVGRTECEAGSLQWGVRSFVLEEESCTAHGQDSAGISGMRTDHLSLDLSIPCSHLLGDQGPCITHCRAPRLWEG